MRISDDNLMRFARRVHWRLVVVRAAERSGACVGVASVFASVLAGVAMLQRRDAMPLVLATLAIGAIVGVLWGLSRRPTRSEAIAEADRQLKLSDLLATAYAQRGSDDPWQCAVVAIADQRCRSLSPAAVVVHRYGGRTWGGIGLSAAMGLTLALLSGVPQDSRARTVDAKRATSGNAILAETTQAPTMTTAALPASAGNEGISAASDARIGASSDASSAKESNGASSDNTLTRAGNSSSADGERAGQNSASGDAVPHGASDGREAAADASLTSGGGVAADAAPAGGSVDAAGASGGIAVSRGRIENKKSPPWSSSSWGADRAAAGEAVRAGRVPDAYRDVVSEYFRERREDDHSSAR